MSVTYGFYNSIEGDRKYDAVQMSSIFDGLIIDGIFASIGTSLIPKATDTLTVNIGVGKAWFDHTWTLNDAILPIAAPDSDVLLDRIDALVLEINANDNARKNEFKFITGKPASLPQRPTLIDEGRLHQHPLCYIRRKAGSVKITQADITNMVGTKEMPFVTGILQTISLDELLGQWSTELDQFIDNETAAFNVWRDEHQAAFDTWQQDQETTFEEWKTGQETTFESWKTGQESSFENWSTTQKDSFQQWRDDRVAEYTAWFNQLKADLTREQQLLDQWIATEQGDFNTWFENVKNQLGTDQAGHLQNQIDNLNTKVDTTSSDLRKEMSDTVNQINTTVRTELDKEAIKRILTVGFADGEKIFSEDGTMVITTASDGKILTKVFTNSFMTMTVTLKSKESTKIAELVKTFTSDGRTVNSVITYF